MTNDHPDDTELDRRLTRLEDKQEIRELKYRYCYYFHEMNWDSWKELFAEDATVVVEREAIGTLEGPDGLDEFAEIVEGSYQWLIHMVHNPVIEIDGRRATGKWVFEVPAVLEDGTPQWLSGIYDEEYEVVDGEWKYTKVHGSFNYRADYDEGWADEIPPNRETRYE